MHPDTLTSRFRQCLMHLVEGYNDYYTGIKGVYGSHGPLARPLSDVPRGCVAVSTADVGKSIPTAWGGMAHDACGGPGRHSSVERPSDTGRRKTQATGGENRRAPESLEERREKIMCL